MQAFAFSRDGAQLLLFEEDQPVRAWDYAGGQPPPQSNPPEQRRGPKSGFGPMFSRATFSPDRALIALTEGGRVRLIDAASGVEKQSMPAFEQGVATVAFSPDSQRIAVSPLFTEVETVIKLYSTATGKQTGQLIGHVSWVPGLAFSSDGQRLISAGGDQTVRIWDVPEGKQIAALRGHFSEVTSVAIAPDGKTIVSGCKDGTMFGWDAERLEAKKSYELLPTPVRSIEFVPHSNALLSVNVDGSVALWDATTLQERERITALGNNVERVVMSPDGRWLYAGTRRGPIRVLDWTNQVLVTNLTASAGPDSSCTPLAVTEHGRTLITAGPGSLIRLWNLASGEARVLSSPTQGAPFPRPGFFDFPFALSTDEHFLAVSGPDRAVDLFDLTSGQKQASLNLENWGSMGFAFSHDNAQLAVASLQGTILLWDLSSRNIVDELRGHLMGVNDVTFSPDGARLASASAKNEAVKLWDAATQHEVATLAGRAHLSACKILARRHIAGRHQLPRQSSYLARARTARNRRARASQPLTLPRPSDGRRPRCTAVELGARIFSLAEVSYSYS